MKDIGVVIPVYCNEETIGLVEKCIETINIEKDRILLVDNTPQSLCKKFEKYGYNVLFHPENLGVARSWNLGIKQGHDWTFLVSCSVRFPESFTEVVNVLEKHNSEYIFMTYLGWHLTAVSKKLVEKIGYFDENFYPAYCEDTDYVKRMHISNIPMELKEVPAYIQKVNIGLISGARVNESRTDRYWREKWGAGVNEVGYPLPFGDKPIDYWESRTIKDLLNGEER